MTKPALTVNKFIKLLVERPTNYYNSAFDDYPLVSIISSFYNAHQYFESTYQAVMNQTWQNFEWIIVDDCSTKPEAIALFKSLEQRNPKIRTYYHQYNQGLAAGRNTAISYAKGKYLFFIDLDDLIDPTYVEKCLLFLETHPDFSFVNSYSVGFQAEEYWWEHGFDKPSRFIQKNWVTGRLLYRKSDFDLSGDFDPNLRFYEDWERWLKGISNGQKSWTIPEYLDCYRRTKDGLHANYLARVQELKRLEQIVQSRYQQFFAENQLEDISLPRLSAYEVKPSKHYLQLENSLGRQQNGKRILCFFPYLEIGGSDKFNLDLLTLLKEKQYDLTIATTLKADHAWHHRFYELTPDIFHLPNIISDCYWLDITRYLIKSRNIDLVFISNSYVAYYFLPFLRSEFPQVTFVDYTHVDDPGWKGFGYPRIASQYTKFLDLQIVSSHALGQLYQSLNPGTKDRLRVCYSNVDVEYWSQNKQMRQEKRKSLGIDEDTICLLYPARIVPQKRPLFLLDIMKALKDKNLPIKLIVLGNGYLMPNVQEKINSLELASVVDIFEPVNSEEMKPFYAAADIFLLPSEYEGISVAIYEAMSMELPVVASDVCGQKELVIPNTGFLLPKGEGDSSEVEAYLQALIPLIRDADLRLKIGQAARQRVVQNFTLSQMGDRMEEIFTEAMEKRINSEPENYDLSLAEESLIGCLESNYLEREWNWLHHYFSQQLEENKQRQLQEAQLLKERIEAMETSKFWQLRKKWFQIKRFLKLTTEED